MAVATAKTGHLYMRVWPAVWIVAAAAAIIFSPKAVGAIGLILVVMMAFVELSRMAEEASRRSRQNKQGPWVVEWLLLGIFPVCLLQVGHLGDQAAMAWLVGVVFVSDVGGYYGGKGLSRLTGGHKLMPKVSPGKTWEGVIAGLAGATLWNSIMLPFGFGLNPVQLYGAAWGLAVVGLCGDLLESWLKRQAGVKDSGTLLRDHGGVLDRIDALLAAAPVAALLLWAWL